MQASRSMLVLAHWPNESEDSATVAAIQHLRTELAVASEAASRLCDGVYCGFENDVRILKIVEKIIQTIPEFPAKSESGFTLKVELDTSHCTIEL